MKIFFELFLRFAFCFLYVSFCFGERLSDQIYLKIDGGRFHCFRLLNGTHQIGCQSNKSGNIGVVVYFDNVKRFAELYENLSSDMNYIIAFDEQFLNQEVTRILLDSKIVGVLILQRSEEFIGRRLDDPKSEDSTCPNQNFGIYANNCKVEWNKRGSILPEGIRFIDWGKPVFLIRNKTEINIIKNQCYGVFNRNLNSSDSPKCSAMMKHFMYAAGNAKICLRRQEYYYSFSEDRLSVCDPLEDINLFSIFPPPSNYESDNLKVILVTARMDSFSMFTDGAVGDVSVLTSLISLLAVAKAIGDNSKDFSAAANLTHRAVMFSFFHGESLGYIGSSRFVEDLKTIGFPPKLNDSSNQNSFSLKLDDIEAFVEVQQLDGLSSKLYAHVDGKMYHSLKGQVDKMVFAANKAIYKLKKKSITIANTERNAHLPPSSFQIFLNEKMGIPGFIIAPFKEKYAYTRINSFDDSDVFLSDSNDVKDEIIQTATAVLGTILGYLYGDDYDPEITYVIDKYFVDELFECFILSIDWYSCELFKRLMSNVPNRPNTGTKTTYISGGNSPSLIRLLVNSLLVHTLGYPIANITEKTDCDALSNIYPGYRFTWQYEPISNSSVCYRSTIYETLAKSPAFHENGYTIKDNNYSTWVESVWSSPELILFLTSDVGRKHDLIVLGIGLAFLLMSCAIMQFIYATNKHLLKPPNPPYDIDLYASPL